MPRILPIELDHTDARTSATLEAVENKLGMLPNLLATLARAPAALNGYLQFSDALSQGRLNARQRELIALAVAQENACAYCLSAHTAIAQSIGLSGTAIDRARRRGSSETLDEALIELARHIVQSRAMLDDDTLERARRAGLDDGLIIETIAHVGLNLLTNYVNHVADTEVDFPVISLSPAA